MNGLTGSQESFLRALEANVQYLRDSMKHDEIGYVYVKLLENGGHSIVRDVVKNDLFVRMKNFTGFADLLPGRRYVYWGGRKIEIQDQD